jgi:hypothetical protein
MTLTLGSNDLSRQSVSAVITLQSRTLSWDELRYVLDLQAVYGSDPSTGSRLTRCFAAEARQAGQVFPGEAFRMLKLSKKNPGAAPGLEHDGSSGCRAKPGGST